MLEPSQMKDVSDDDFDEYGNAAIQRLAEHYKTRLDKSALMDEWVAVVRFGRRSRTSPPGSAAGKTSGDQCRST